MGVAMMVDLIVKSLAPESSTNCSECSAALRTTWTRPSASFNLPFLGRNRGFWYSASSAFESSARTTMRRSSSPDGSNVQLPSTPSAVAGMLMGIQPNWRMASLETS